MARARRDHVAKWARKDGERVESRIDAVLQPFWGAPPSTFLNPAVLNRIHSDRLQALYLTAITTIGEVLDSGAPLEFSENLRIARSLLQALARSDPSMSELSFKTQLRGEVGAVWQKVKGSKKR